MAKREDLGWDKEASGWQGSADREQGRELITAHLKASNASSLKAAEGERSISEEGHEATAAHATELEAPGRHESESDGRLTLIIDLHPDATFAIDREGTEVFPASSNREIRDLLEGDLSIADAVLPHTTPQRSLMEWGVLS